jgi:hypothetical protein
VRVVFPSNQNYLSGKGFGNLIALPLFKPTFEKGNSCFINPETSEPITDQWDFLSRIKKVSIDHLDLLYAGLRSAKDAKLPIAKNGKLTISLKNYISLSRNGLTPTLINYLKEELNFANSEYFIKKKSGRNTFKTTRYFKK